MLNSIFKINPKFSIQILRRVVLLLLLARSFDEDHRCTRVRTVAYARPPPPPIVGTDVDDEDAFINLKKERLATRSDASCVVTDAPPPPPPPPLARPTHRRASAVVGDPRDAERIVRGSIVGSFGRRSVKACARVSKMCACGGIFVWVNSII